MEQKSKYEYFVSYFCRRNGVPSLANCCVAMDKPFSGADAIMSIGETLSTVPGISEPVILFWRPLEREEEEMELGNLVFGNSIGFGCRICKGDLT